MKTKYVEINYRVTLNVNVSFIPDITINCDPPYVQGKRTSTWVQHHYGPLPKVTDKRKWESKLGMALQPWVPYSEDK